MHSVVKDRRDDGVRVRAMESRESMAVPLPVTRSAPVAYLTNVYPHVSHSFIRREILALEKCGIPVVRFSIRRSSEALPDIDDQSEQARTIVLLDASVAAFVSVTLRALFSHPVRFGRAVRMAIAMGRVSAVGVWRNLIYLVEACLLAQAARQRGIRHVHAHFGTNSAAVARLAKAVGDVSYSMTVHGPDEFDANAALSLPAKIADAAFVVAISSHGIGQLMRWSHFTHWPKISVVRCGLDGKFLEHGRSKSRSGSRVFVCVARLDAQKGVGLLIEAAHLLGPELDFKLRIIGDGAMRAELAGRIVALGLSDRVVLCGWQSSANIRTELERARALVLSSFAEGLPVVLMEAMAVECPVIATAIAGIPELVDSECGWVVPSGSAEAMAAAMRTALLADEKALRTMGAEGRQRVLASHDAVRNAGQLAELLAAHA